MGTLSNNYCRKYKSGYKRAKRVAFIDKVHKFDQKLAHDNARTIHSKKNFIKWLQK